MKFATLPLAEAEGAVLAHTMHLASGTLKKGRRLTAADVARLADDGVAAIMAARIEAGDIGEDEAAARIAALSSGRHARVADAFTGRANLIAEVDGLAVVDRDRLIALNGIDEGLTIATVAPFERVVAGQLVATVKIIPFALPAQVVEAAAGLLGGRQHDRSALVEVAPFQPRRCGLVQTRVVGMKPSLLDKRVRAMQQRLNALASTLDHTETVPHETAAVAEATRRLHAAGYDIILLFGASAIVDRGDVVPQALIDAGGEVVHLGMPVDPGNLLMMGRLGRSAVVGVPSCATSPKLNGFDWVLSRLVAGLPVGRAEIVAMAPGGLLTEIESRPQPRAPKAK